MGPVLFRMKKLIRFCLRDFFFLFSIPLLPLKLGSVGPKHSNNIRYGVVGNISGFHPGAAGSIPGSGISIFCLATNSRMAPQLNLVQQPGLAITQFAPAFEPCSWIEEQGPLKP